MVEQNENEAKVVLKPLKITMKAQQYDPRDKQIHLNEVPVPTPKAHELLVQVVAASLCHTDFLVYEGHHKDEPTTMGHEATGLVAKLGSDVTGFSIGDRIGFLPIVDCCFECVACKTWSPVQCLKGSTVQGFFSDGFYAEYALVDARNAMILPESLDITRAAPLFCAGVTAFHSVEECQLKPGQWIAIVGVGGLGQLAVRYAKAMNIKIIVVDIHDAQLEQAKVFGADHAFNANTDAEYIAQIVALTGGGVDAAINFTSSVSAYSTMPAMIRPITGILMVSGVPAEPLQFNPMDIIFRRYIIKGACNGTCYNMAEAIEFSTKHNIQPMMDVYSLEELPKMMNKMKSGEARTRMGIRFH